MSVRRIGLRMDIRLIDHNTICHCERVVRGNERAWQSRRLINERNEIASLTVARLSPARNDRGI